MKKTLITLVAVCALLFTFGTVTASAATDGTYSEGIYTYSVSDGSAAITGCAMNADGHIVIPGTLGGYPVTSIGARAFSECRYLEGITIPDSVISIGERAFCGCSGIADMTIPDSVTSIGAYAFYSCEGLVRITLPNSITSIENNTFSYCLNLVSITIPDGVTSIGNDAFYYCRNLVSITLPDGITTIGDDAFEDCRSLASISIPDSVTSIGSDAFEYCNSLENVYITDLEAWCKIDFSNSYSNPLSHAEDLYLNGNLVTDITIPDGITGIGAYAFYGCSNLVNISISDGVTDIGAYAFCGCNNLVSISLPNSITSIKNYAFSNCSSLVSITIPDSITSIPLGAFSGCTSLVNIIIPNSITNIGGDAFGGCSSLINISLPDGIASIENFSFFDCTSLVSITIPDSVTSLAYGAFWGCNSLKSISIPDSVTSIGESAFYNCDSLESITIPDSVTSIGDWAFSDCTRLVTATIGKGVTVIPEYAFYNSSRLEYIALPAEIKYVRTDAFNGCSDIKTVFYAGSEAQWNNILFYSRNENLTDAEIVYGAARKTYKFETNCDAVLNDITDYAVFTMPTVQNDELKLLGWYDNAALSGAPVAFPYYGEATTLYAAWTDRTGSSYEDAFIAKENREYPVTTTENGQYVYFKFVPTLSKEYRFYTTGNKDTYGCLYVGSNGIYSLVTSNENSGEGSNFSISYNLTAGLTYYIAVGIYDGPGTATFVVEEPVDYRINEITIKDMAGNSLTAIPAGKFLATVSFTNVSSDKDAVIALTQYTAAGAFGGLLYIQPEDIPIGSTIKLSVPVNNTNGDVAKLKAFCLDSLTSSIPMGNSVSFPSN